MMCNPGRTDALKSAVVLVSGGLDSTTALAIAREQGFSCHALTFDYGQRQKSEIDAAANVVNAQHAAKHVVIELDLRLFGMSALTAEIEVPKNRSDQDIGQGIPITYVPARNTIFLSYALAFAESIGSEDIFIGVNAIDYSGYPDCRPEFIGAYQRMATLATKAGVEGRQLRIHAPLIEDAAAKSRPHEAEPAISCGSRLASTQDVSRRGTFDCGVFL